MKKTNREMLKVNVMVWSEIGHTPLTNRVGAYCDELVNEVTTCTSPEDAFEYVKGLMKHTKHASKAHYYIPEYWNQNLRSRWITMSDCI